MGTNIGNDDLKETEKGFDMSTSKTTTNHDEIKKWAESRDGKPAKVREDGGKGGILRIDFGEPEDSLEPIEWKEFFDVFDERKLAFLYQDKTQDGHISRFSKFVSRD